MNLLKVDGKIHSNLLMLVEPPSTFVNFISLVTSCVGLLEEEPQAAHLMSFTWASHISRENECPVKLIGAS